VRPDADDAEITVTSLPLLVKEINPIAWDPSGIKGKAMALAIPHQKVNKLAGPMRGPA
jgi:hypothetical protein